MKHSKYLNSGLINYLIENIITSKISKNDKTIAKDFMKYVKLIKSLPLIREELKFYDQLTTSFVEKRYLGSKLLSEIKKDLKKVEWDNLSRQRQMFFDKTKKIFPELLTEINNRQNKYKLFASIQNFIDDAKVNKLTAKERIIVEENIIENLSNGFGITEFVDKVKEYNEIPLEADPLVVSIMIKDFNKKWKSVLSETQYKYLVDYTSNGNSINSTWINRIKKSLNQYNPELIKSEEISNKVEKIITEVTNKTTFNSENILQYCELIDSLKEFSSKTN